LDNKVLMIDIIVFLSIERFFRKGQKICDVSIASFKSRSHNRLENRWPIFKWRRINQKKKFVFAENSTTWEMLFPFRETEPVLFRRYHSFTVISLAYFPLITAHELKIQGEGPWGFWHFLSGRVHRVVKMFWEGMAFGLLFHFY
jgi:hypothetical protein